MTFNAVFRKWFGGSEVTDDDGRPLVVYHGTGPAFTSFEPGHRTGVTVPRKGFYFTDDKNAAREFGSQVVAAYLSIQRPADFRRQYATPETDRLMWRVVKRLPREEQDEFFDPFGGKPVSTYRATSNGLLQTDKFLVAVRELGYDGLFIDDALGHSMYFNTYIAFEPTQIKLAEGNDGTWDADDPDIRSNPPLRVLAAEASQIIRKMEKCR